MITQKYTPSRPNPTTPGPRRPVPIRVWREHPRLHHAPFLTQFEAALTDAFTLELAERQGRGR